MIYPIETCEYFHNEAGCDRNTCKAKAGYTCSYESTICRLKERNNQSLGLWATLDGRGLTSKTEELNGCSLVVIFQIVVFVFLVLLIGWNIVTNKRQKQRRIPVERAEEVAQGTQDI